jgi:hypothetical protein
MIGVFFNDLATALARELSEVMQLGFWALFKS